MAPTRRSGTVLVLASVVAILAAIAWIAATDASPAPTRVRSATTASVSPSPLTAAGYLRYRAATPKQPFTDLLEPFDYTQAAPPLERTPIDGYYMRIVRLDQVGGPHWGLPFHCRRCPAFRVDPGVETLLMYRGRWWLEHQMSTFRALGHYDVDGLRVRFFNDPNCSRTPGTYRWSSARTSLSFRVLDDPCPFEDERADDLMFSPWIHVRPCRSGIQYWWPALIGCKSEESGVRP